MQFDSSPARGLFFSGKDSISTGSCFVVSFPDVAALTFLTESGRPVSKDCVNSSAFEVA